MFKSSGLTWDRLKKLWIGQWHFCLQLTIYSCDYKQKVPLATTSFSSRFHNFQVDLKSTLHVRTFRTPSAAAMQSGIREYMPPIDIFVKLKITYIQFSSPINCERLLMINTIIELIWCYMLGFNCYMVGTTMTLWNSESIGWCCGSCRRLTLQLPLLSPRVNSNDMHLLVLLSLLI